MRQALRDFGPWSKGPLSNVWPRGKIKVPQLGTTTPNVPRGVWVLVVPTDDLCALGSLILAPPEKNAIISTVVEVLHLDRETVQFHLVSTTPPSDSGTKSKRTLHFKPHSEHSSRYLSPTRAALGLEVGPQSLWMDPSESPRPQYLVLVTKKSSTSS